MVHGTTITLINLIQTGTDPFNAPVYEETQTAVENVLVAQPSASQVIDQMNLYGKRLAYTLGIPKGDMHIWKDQDVIIFGERFHVFTDVTKGIEENIPGPWHHIYGVERYG